MSLMDHRKFYRETKRKDAHNATRETRTAIGQPMGQTDGRMIVEQYTSYGQSDAYRSDAKLQISGNWNGETEVLIEIEVASYTRTGARRTMHHSLTLPRDIAEAMTKALQGGDVDEAIKALPGARRINEKMEYVTP